MANRVGISGRSLDLFVRFTNEFDEPIDTDKMPKVTITDSMGVIRQSLSNSGVSLYESPGIYKFSYNIPRPAPDGYWTDTWVAEIGGQPTTASFVFSVSSVTEIEEIIEPEYTPGAETDFDLSLPEVIGLNALLKLLKHRLKNTGTRKVPDGYGGFTDRPCSVFSDEELTSFLYCSLSDFNSTPYFTQYTFSDPSIYGIFADIIIQGASLLAYSAQALIEKGREFQITDSGLSFQPPAISDMLNTQFSAQYSSYRERLKFIKFNIRPGPKSLGTFRTTAVAPAFLRLRHLRAKQIL